MSAVLVVKLNDGTSMLHGRHDLNYGVTRAEQQALAESLVAQHKPDKTLAAFGLAENEILEPYIEGGHNQDEILVDEEGNVTLPE